MDEQPLTIWAVTINYGGSSSTYPAAAFPTKELAEAYVRYSNNLQGKLVPITFEIREYPFYSIDFEWAYRINEEARNK